MTNNLTQRNTTLDYSFVFLLIVYAGRGSSFVRAVDTWDNLVGLLLPIVFSAIVAGYYKITISKKFISLIIGFVIYNIILTFKFREFHPRFMGIYLISFFIAYVAYSSLRFRFFLYYEKILYYLCIIALGFWGIQYFMFETLANIFQSLPFTEPASGNVLSNVFIYTLPDVTGFESYIVSIGPFSVIRNAGFAWEPGAFAVYINLAIFINLIRTKFTIRGNKYLIVFIISLITTFSTTGFSMFMALMVFYMYNKNIRYKIYIAPVLIVLLVYITSLPFMAEKVADVANYDTDEMITSSIDYPDEEITPQRIQSLQIDYIDFLNNPIWGYGGNPQERWTAKLGADISTISGIGKVMAVFGIVGILFFFINLTITSIDLARTLQFVGWGFPFLLIIAVSISYSIIFNPVLMCFWLMNRKYLR